MSIPQILFMVMAFLMVGADVQIERNGRDYGWLVELALWIGAGFVIAFGVAT